jgi:gliding-associated putative ABC transporter substrate-binding component GldG
MEALRRAIGSFGGWLTRLATSKNERQDSPQTRSQAAAFSAAGLLLFAGCLVFLFLLSSRAYLRWDLSDGKLYSLSDGSKRLMKGLRTPVEIRAYFSKELPPQYAATRSYVRDLLQEYRNASKGKVRFQFIDLEKDERAKQDALGQGIAPVQFNIIAKEKYEVREGFMGLILKYEDKKEVVPLVQDTAGLEYDLTSRIVRLTRDKRKVIGMVASHGAVSAARLQPQLREVIERNYELRDVDLKSLKAGATVSADVSALLILGPSEKLADEHLFALDQFILSGRPVAFGLDARRTDLRSFYATDLETGLRDFLAHYGVHSKNNFVMDAQSQKVSIQQQRGWLLFSNIIDYPPYVIATDLSREHPVTRELDSLTLPFVSPLEVSTRTSAGKLLVLAKSSKLSWLRSSWAKGGFLNINPVQDYRPAAGDPKGPFVLAASIEDSFQSYFSTAAHATRVLPKGASALQASNSGNGRLLVVGTARFAEEDLRSRGTGPVFLLNIIDWLALDSDLIAIRSKGGVFKPLREVPAGYKTLVRWGNILAPALLVILFGAWRMYRRRRLLLRRIAAYTPATRVEEKAYASQNA